MWAPRGRYQDLEGKRKSKRAGKAAQGFSSWIISQNGARGAVHGRDECPSRGADKLGYASQDRNRLANHGGGTSIIARRAVGAKCLFPNK